MPRIFIDYSNTIIYKIMCNDPLIHDVYVGHTTNFTQKKHAHKVACNNVNSSSYNLKLYKTIRDHGNWSNWNMYIISSYNCKNLSDAKQKERDHIILLGSTLNDVGKTSNYKSELICVKPEKQYDCNKCLKIFNDRAGMWRHKRKQCEPIDTIDTIDTIATIATIDTIDTIDTIAKKDTNQLTNLVMTLIKQNQELTNQIIELSKTSQINNNTTNNNTTNNKTFNIQVYLNDDCKNALNMNEFVSSIQVQIQDLEETGRLGYVEGISRIINNNLNNLEATQRPIQCSDLKRETLYIKNDNIWVKENEKKENIKLAIRQIANKNVQQIGNWVKAHPKCRESDSRKNDTYLNIVSNAMSGTTTEEQINNVNKIVTNVAKKVTIDK
jgi:hypothetical protein